MENKFIIVPLGGNSFITNKPQSERDGITKEGWEQWDCAEHEYHVFFKPAVDATLTLTLILGAPTEGCTIKAGLGKPDSEITVAAGATEIALGSYETTAGYVDVAVQGVSKEGEVFAFPTALKVEGVEDAEMASYARESDKQDFYWIRRGPSVHCGYDVSAAGEDVEWFYNEIGRAHV